MRVAEMPLTPDQPQRAPNTPKSDFHKYAESVLSPIGIETPGAPFNSGLLKIPTSRDWSPYDQQSQGVSGRNGSLDYFGFGDHTGMDMYSHGRSSSADIQSSGLLLSPGFTFDDMIGISTPTTDTDRLHRVNGMGGEISKGMNLFGSSTTGTSIQGGRKSSGNQRKRAQKKKSEFDTDDDIIEIENSRGPTSPGLAAITAAARRLAKQNKSRTSKSSSTIGEGSEDNESDSGDDVPFQSSTVSNNNGAPRKGRPPVHPPRPHSPGKQQGQSQNLPGSPGASLDGMSGSEVIEELQGYTAIAPRSNSTSKSFIEVQATPETAGTATHPSMSPDPKNSAPCNCKKSRCLKLYCDCFRAQKYCSGCHCKSCANLEIHESERIAARNSITERNPEAFKPRIALYGTQNSKEREVIMASSTRTTSTLPASSAVFGQHQSGCHCKKSACLKKYCECFQAGVPCLDRCRCLDCKNTAENLATGFSNISKGPTGGALLASSGTPVPFDTIQQLSGGRADGGGRLSLLSSCFPESDVPDDKPIYNKQQAEQAAFEIVSAFLRGEITVPGFESLSAGGLTLGQRVAGFSSQQYQQQCESDSKPLMSLSAVAAQGSGVRGEDGGLGNGQKLLSGDKQLSANSSLVHMSSMVNHIA